ncbi:hypothetical protein BXZ70DRAFT_613062 [Cristinia sonorae]|uniref:DUF5745 domain-containing protein n=1 Tax=Cristinia sonorae TaxID=1940300 RepID=A0A8K0XT76_9AGAR|nr:hypothetical protein BXZ70DRAFT_613062 [Cristinia sonorae]
MSSSNDSTDPVDIDELVATLNDLLANLHIPIPIDTPLDLTPSLLLGILESILESRLPIASAIRKSRDPRSKVQAMKIFIGVLENDVLGEDVGLADVDPRKLAEGEWDEVVFVGELLCWLGKKYGIIPVADSNARASGSRHMDEHRVASRSQTSSVDVKARTRARSPSPTTHSTATITTRGSLNSALSMMPSAPPQSDTTVLSAHPESPSLSVLDLFDSLEQTKCIHQIDDPFLNSVSVDSDTDPDISTRSQSAPSFCHCPSDEDEVMTGRSLNATPVRYTGWINEVDEELEIRSFEQSRRKPDPRVHNPSLLARSTQSDPDHRLDRTDLFAGISSTSTPRRPSARNTPTGRKTPSAAIVTRHTSPAEHTMALINERAKLMAELANVRTLPRHHTARR